MASNNKKPPHPPRLQAVPKDRAAIQAAVEERRATVKGAGAQGAAKNDGGQAAGGETSAEGQGNSGGNGVVSRQFVRDCLELGERGDGVLFAHLNKDKFAYNAGAGEWIEYTGHAWQLDQVDECRRALPRTVTAAYLDEVDLLREDIGNETNVHAKKALEGLQSDLIKRTKKLDTIARTDNVLRWAATGKDSLAITGDELDANPYLFALANGVLDLETFKLRNGRPDDWISKASPVEFHGLDAPAPTFEQFLDDVFMGDMEIIRYVQMLFGLSLIGEVIEHIFPIFYGMGRNGKGVLAELMLAIHGQYGWMTKPELILAQRFGRSSSGPSADLMGLRDRRIVLCSEPEEGAKMSTGVVKLLTGGDHINAREPNAKREVNFPPRFLLCMLANYHPSAPAGDSAFWMRTRIIRFPVQFVVKPDPAQPHQKPRDQSIRKRLQQEHPGVLAWALRGLRLYSQEGLQTPEAVLTETGKYKDNEDVVAQFLARRCVISQSVKPTLSEELYRDYTDWHQKQGGKAWSQRRWGEEMARHPGIERFKNSAGLMAYRGVALKTDGTDLF